MVVSARMTSHAQPTAAVAPSRPSTRAFDEQLPDQAPAAGANGKAHADFAPACRGPRQQHARDVGAGDQQDESDDAHQRLRRRSRARRSPAAPACEPRWWQPPTSAAPCWSADGPRPAAGPCSAMLACAACAETPGFRRPLTNNQRMPRRSSRVRPGAGTRSVMPAGSTSSACAIGTQSSGCQQRHHAAERPAGATPMIGVRQAAQRQGLTERAAGSAELGLPHAMRDDDDTFGGRRVVGRL